MAITKVSTQIVLGSDEWNRFSREDIERKISLARDLTGLQRLFFWNNGGEDNRDFISGICEKLDIELYSWFPVLADIQSGHVTEEESTLSITGDRGYGASGVWSQIHQGEENFRFACPSGKSVIKRNLKKFKSDLKRGDFKGVFLDRIRYPSFANGLESIFSCVCPECASAYEGDFEKTKVGLEELYHFFRFAEPGELREVGSWHDLVDRFGVYEFFQFRYERIDDIVKLFADYAVAMGLDVGLDLLSPSLQPIVGQDYSRLHRHSNWLKIMSYCYANGPAGIPLELIALARGLQQLNGNGLTEGDCLSFAGRIFGVDIDDNRTIGNILSDGVDPQYLKREVEAAQATMPEYHHKVIPGIELVNQPFFKPPVTEEKCRSYLDVLDSFDTEVILCWNILYIPDDYLRIISGRMK